MPGLCDVSSKFYTISYRFTVYLLCHKKRSLIRSKRNEQGSKQTYLILLFSAPFSTSHERKSTSPVAMDLAFRQGKPRWEYFMCLRELQRSTSAKDASPVTVGLALRQGKPRWEYFMCLRELQRSTSTKARHPWRWILRSGKAKLEGNTLCISESFNAA